MFQTTNQLMALHMARNSRLSMGEYEIKWKERKERKERNGRSSSAGCLEALLARAKCVEALLALHDQALKTEPNRDPARNTTDPGYSNWS